MARLIIARHGNTFSKGDIPTRVGARTDLPLVEKGFVQAAALGAHLKNNNLVPDRVYCSALQRTQQTAQGALDAMGVSTPIIANPLFNEIDYGPDENMPEDIVIDRIGHEALTHWDQNAIVPNGWDVDPEAIIQGWKNFAYTITDNETVLVVTSNGTARFAPYLTGDFDRFQQDHSIKLSTGSYGVLERNNDDIWSCLSWNIKP